MLCVRACACVCGVRCVCANARARARARACVRARCGCVCACVLQSTGRGAEDALSVRIYMRAMRACAHVRRACLVRAPVCMLPSSTPAVFCQQCPTMHTEVSRDQFTHRPPAAGASAQAASSRESRARAHASSELLHGMLHGCVLSVCVHGGAARARGCGSPVTTALAGAGRPGERRAKA